MVIRHLSSNVFAFHSFNFTIVDYYCCNICWYIFISGFAPDKITIDNSVINIANTGTIARTAVGISTSILNFPLMVMLGITSGIGLVTAQYYEVKQKTNYNKLLFIKSLLVYC